MRDLFVRVLNRKSLRNIHKWKVRNCVKLAHLTHKSLVWIWAVYLSYKGRRNDVSVIQQAAERDAKEPWQRLTMVWKENIWSTNMTNTGHEESFTKNSKHGKHAGKKIHRSCLQCQGLFRLSQSRIDSRQRNIPRIQPCSRDSLHVQHECPKRPTASLKYFVMAKNSVLGLMFFLSETDSLG